MGDHVKCVAVIQIPSSSILFLESLKKSSSESFRREIENLLPTITKLTIAPKDYQKVHTSNGTWYVAIDYSRTAFLILSSPQYAVNLSLQMLGEVQSEIQRIPKYYDPATKLENILKTSITMIMKKFDNEGKDAIENVSKTVDTVTLQMEKNINKILDNGQALHRVDGKAEELVSMAGKFKVEAQYLRRKMEMRKFITTLVIVVVCFVLLLALAFSSSTPEVHQERTNSIGANFSAHSNNTSPINSSRL